MKIGFIGCGQMAQALANGIAPNHKSDEELEFVLHDPSYEAVEQMAEGLAATAKVQLVEANQRVAENCDILFIAVKPQRIVDALEDVDLGGLKQPPLLVSVAAGVTIYELERLTSAERIVRAMPNTPCLIGVGATGIAPNDAVSDEELANVEALLKCVGDVHLVTEEQLDAVTGLSGSGPAYVFTFIESLADGGVLNGLPRKVAVQLAVQTVIGAAKLVQHSGEHTSVLKDRVTSPGGTTIAGLKALEETGFRDGVMSAVSAATERSVELGGR